MKLYPFSKSQPTYPDDDIHLWCADEEDGSIPGWRLRIWNKDAIEEELITTGFNPFLESQDNHEDELLPLCWTFVLI